VRDMEAYERRLREFEYKSGVVAKCDETQLSAYVSRLVVRAMQCVVDGDSAHGEYCIFFVEKPSHVVCVVLKNHAVMHRRHLVYSFIHFVCLKQERNRGGGGQGDGDRSGRAGAIRGRRSGGRRSGGAPRRRRRAGGGSSTSRARSTPRGCGEH
jgi:hypothetical protein